MIDNLKLVDFNDIYVIAVGVSMAYIVVESKVEKSSFFSILSKITTSVKELLLRGKKSLKEKEEKITTQIDYYIESGLLKDITKGSLLNTNKRAKEEVYKIKELENWVERKLQFHTKTEFLNVISFDCFLYSLFILFVGALQNKCELCIDGLIQVILFSIGILLVHCLCFERLEIESWKWYFKPRIILHGIVLCVALIVGIYTYDTPIIPNISCGWLSIISVFACFIGFIAYLFTNVLSNCILSIIILCKALLIGVSEKKAKEHENEMEQYREEFDDIDAQLMELNLSESITIENRQETR